MGKKLFEYVETTQTVVKRLTGDKVLPKYVVARAKNASFALPDAAIGKFFLDALNDRTDFDERLQGDGYGPEISQSTSEYINEMQKLGYRVLTPEPNQLFIDIDTEWNYYYFLQLWHNVFLRYFTKATMVETPSKNGLPGRHIIITVPDMYFTPTERLALQASLGSDRIRELLSMVRYFNLDTPETIFIENQ